MLSGTLMKIGVSGGRVLVRGWGGGVLGCGRGGVLRCVGDRVLGCGRWSVGVWEVECWGVGMRTGEWGCEPLGCREANHQVPWHRTLPEDVVGWVPECGRTAGFRAVID